VRMVLPAGARWAASFAKRACSQMRMKRTEAPESGVVGAALKVTCVAFGMAVITVYAGIAPVPAVRRTGMPTRSCAVLPTLRVVPLLLTPVRVGSAVPTRNLMKTQAASQLAGAEVVRQLFCQLMVKRTSTVPVDVLWSTSRGVEILRLLAHAVQLRSMHAAIAIHLFKAIPPPAMPSIGKAPAM